MFIFEITIALLSLASMVQAAPWTFDGVDGTHPKKGCSLSQAPLPSSWPPNLTKPTSKPTYLMVGSGTQNYTCSSGTYSSIGAVAKLYDVSCLATNPILEYMPELMYQFSNEELMGYSIFPNIDILEPSMHHFFVNESTGSLSPRFNLDPAGELLAYSTMKKVQDATSPTDSTDNVDWLMLTDVDGSLANTVYRVSTYLGQPPASCTSDSAEITVQYAALYYIYKS